MQGEKKWFAIRVQAFDLKRVIKLLVKRQIEYYYPYHKIREHEMSGRRLDPIALFPEMIFVSTSLDHSFIIKTLGGNISFYYWLSEVASFKNEDIELLKKFVNESQHIELEKIYVSATTDAKVLSEPTVSREGKLYEIKHEQIKVSIPSIGYIFRAKKELQILDNSLQGAKVNMPA